jgi:hypothetical protein
LPHAYSVTVEVSGRIWGERSSLIITEPGDSDLKATSSAFHKGAERRQIEHESDNFRITPRLEEGNDSRPPGSIQMGGMPQETYGQERNQFVESADKAFATLFAVSFFLPT